MLLRLMHLLRGERIRLTSKHDKATKQVINASSCILFCCLSKLYREVECFTTKLWKQTAPAYTASIPAAAMQCLLHSPPKITEGLIKYLHFFVCLPLQVRVDSHLLSMVQGRQWRHGRRLVLVYSQNINKIRGHKFVS